MRIAPLVITSLVLATAALGCGKKPPAETPVVTATPVPTTTPVPTATTATVAEQPRGSIPPVINATAAQAASPYRLVVSFISPGNGTDQAAFARFEKLVAAHPKKPAHTTSRWGREGEHDECFTLDELTVAERAAFVAAVKKEMAASQRVNVREDGECTKGR